MTNYTDAELESMLADIESDLAERKETLKGDAPNKVRETICAFANDLPDHRRAGVVFIGAKDNGEPVNLDVTDELLRQLADMKTDGKIVPPPTITVSKRRLRGADMAVVLVEPADSPPVSCSGHICIRIGPRRGYASAQDERILNEKRRYKDLPFDINPVPSAALHDLNLRYFEEEYLPEAVAPEVLEANSRSIEQRLAATKMIASVDDTTPTILGLLVLGSSPRDTLPCAYIQFLRIAGTLVTDPIDDEQVIDGRLGDMLRRIDEKMIAHNRAAISFVDSAREIRTQPYPHAALQQLVRNAVMHRTYENTNAPIHVYWYDDRIEIQSPGGTFGTVNETNFGEPGYVDYRNPNIAEALRVLGYVQRFGMGIPTARLALEKNGNPPLEFTVTPSRIQILVRAAL